MSEIIHYDLPYRENGEKKSLHLIIDFISKGIINDFNKMTSDSFAFQDKFNKLNKNADLIADLKDKKPSDYKKQIEKLGQENDQLTKDMMLYKENDFFENRTNLIKRIFIQNNIKDEKYLSDDFWNECVDTYELVKFLDTVMLKDIKDFMDGKKKVS